jgi:hypothetical protein
MAPLAKLTEPPLRATSPPRTIVFRSAGSGPKIPMPVKLTRCAVTSTWPVIEPPSACGTKLRSSVATVMLPTQLPLMVTVEPASKWLKARCSRPLSSTQFTVFAVAGAASARLAAMLAQASLMFMMSSRTFCLLAKRGRNPAEGEIVRQPLVVVFRYFSPFRSTAPIDAVAGRADHADAP